MLLFNHPASFLPNLPPPLLRTATDTLPSPPPVTYHHLSTPPVLTSFLHYHHLIYNTWENDRSLSHHLPSITITVIMAPPISASPSIRMSLACLPPPRFHQSPRQTSTIFDFTDHHQFYCISVFTVPTTTTSTISASPSLHSISTSNRTQACA